MYQESALKQIEYYCSEIEKLEQSAPLVAAIIEKCALDAVPSLCQVGPGTNTRKCSVTRITVTLFSMFYPPVPPTQSKNEAKIFERFKVNWKFVGLISAIIEKSWPSQTPHHDDGMVLQHLLSWTAAKHIFQLYGKKEGVTSFYVENRLQAGDVVISGAEENKLAKLSEEAKKKMDAAITALVAISDDLADGNIKIALLNVILEKKEAYLDLLKIGNNHCRRGTDMVAEIDR